MSKELKVSTTLVTPPYHCNTYAIICTMSLLLGEFAKLRKVTVSFVMSVRPSVWNNSAPTERLVMKFNLKLFRKSVEKIQVSLKSDKNNGYFT
jgi:hypothetical protein